jgi:lipoyl-dependent peroxiredoxin
MMSEARTLYTAEVHTVGGRDKGSARSSDGRLDVVLSVPGGPGAGTNPEQLFAAGWSACFEGAITIAARRLKMPPPADVAIDAAVSLNQNSDGYSLSARLTVHLPELDRSTAQQLVEAAHATCPYSKATRDNIAVEIVLADVAPAAI